jgi:ankyrin repeat protein
MNLVNVGHSKGNGNRPIHIAAQNGHTDVVRLLVNKKCLLNEMNMKGNTAIHMAVGYDYYDAAKLIIDAGGDPRILNSAGGKLEIFLIINLNSY